MLVIDADGPTSREENIIVNYGTAMLEDIVISELHYRRVSAQDTNMSYKCWLIE
jgi:hypothetical protein